MDDSLRHLLSEQINNWEHNLAEVVVNQYRIKWNEVQEKTDDLVCKLMGLDETIPQVVLTDTEFSIALGAIRIRFAREAIDKNDPEHCLTHLLYVAETVGLATVDKEAAIKKARSEFTKPASDARQAENRDMKAQGLAWYAEHRDEFTSKDEAAHAMTRIVPMKFSTTRKWLKGQ